MKKQFISKIKTNNNIIIKKKRYNIYYTKLEFYSKLGKIYYIFSKNVKINFYKKTNIIQLTTKKKKIINLYNTLIYNIIFSSLGGYFIKLNLKGRGYNINLKKKHNILELKLGFSHIIRIYLNKNILIKKINKLSIYLFSLSYMDIKNYTNIIKNLKKIDNYKGKGFNYEKEKIKLKEGKKKY